MTLLLQLVAFGIASWLFGYVVGRHTANTLWIAAIEQVDVEEMLMREIRAETRRRVNGLSPTYGSDDLHARNGGVAH